MGVQLAHGIVVEEEQRLRPLHDDIVYTHGHEIDANRIVALEINGDFKLGADAVRA